MFCRFVVFLSSVFLFPACFPTQLEPIDAAPPDPEVDSATPIDMSTVDMRIDSGTPIDAAAQDAASIDATRADAGRSDAGYVYDPRIGIPIEGPLQLDDARVLAVDPSTLRAGSMTCHAPVLARVHNAPEYNDGDTIHVTYVDPVTHLDSRVSTERNVTIRMIGVNAPEVAHSTPPSDAECYGPEAQTFTAQLRGHLVWLTFDANCLDPYDRTLAYIHLGAGPQDFFQRQLLLRGFAKKYPFRDTPTYASLFYNDDLTAQRNHVGLWSACP